MSRSAQNYSTCDFPHFTERDWRLTLPGRTKGIAMYANSQQAIPLQIIFGAGYVPEKHRDDAHRDLPCSEQSDSAFAEFVESLKSLCQGE